MAMNGMQMLFKQLGFDPDKIIKDVETFMAGLKEHVTQQNLKLDRIETKLDTLLQHKLTAGEEEHGARKPS